MDVRRHTDVVGELLPLAGATIADVGCGRGGLARWLAREAALVLGFDLQPRALAATRRASDGAVLVAAATAECLPLADARLDGAVVFNSLHHFPDPDAALAELARVVRPGGTVALVEPLAAGGYFAFMRPVDDETAVRTRALEAIGRATSTYFALATSFDYAYEVVVHDLAAELEGWVAVDPARRPAVEALGEGWRERFETLGRPRDGGRVFDQPMRAWSFQRP